MIKIDNEITHNKILNDDPISELICDLSKPILISVSLSANKSNMCEFYNDTIRIDEKQNLTITFANGDYYKGEMLNGLYHGTGNYIFSNEISYIGEFNHGHFHGKGIIIKNNKKFIVEFNHNHIYNIHE